MDVKQFEGSTPGPWKKIKDDMGWTIFAPNAVSTFDSRTKVVCVLPNHELDATLIAAAPDLLKENQSLRSELQKQKEFNAELVEGLKMSRDLMKTHVPSSQTGLYVEWIEARDVIESLIKKSKES